MPHSQPHESLEALPQSLAGQAREFQQAADYAGDGGGAGESGAAAIPRLVAWAKKRGKLIPEARFESLGPPISNSTSEHEVWFDETSERAVKRTWAGVYGQIPCAENGSVFKAIRFGPQHDNGKREVFEWLLLGQTFVHR